MSLFVDLDLPEGALLPAPPPTLDALVSAVGGIWFDMDPGSVRGDGAARALTPRVGGLDAIAVEDNHLPTQISPAMGTHALMTRPRKNCGFASAQTLPVVRLSIAAILAGHSGAARTIAGIEGSSGRSFHLSEEDGDIVWGGRKEASVARLPLSPRTDAATLILASLGPDSLHVAVDAERPQAAALEKPFAPDEVYLMIATRRRKPGLFNTLGDMSLSDIAFFPDLDIFASDNKALRQGLLTHSAALC